MQTLMSKQVNLTISCILYACSPLLLANCEKVNDNNDSPGPFALNDFFSWQLASTPLYQHSGDMFPEGSQGTGLAFRKNVARVAWYIIDPLFYTATSFTPNHILYDVNQRSNHFVRGVLLTEIWPNQTIPEGVNGYINILNIAFYPTERGFYNYDSSPGLYSMGIVTDGKLVAPASRWAGIMRELRWPAPGSSYYDDYRMGAIEFWLMDPFVYDNGHMGGDFFINIGDISEDILRDGRRSFESGLPTTQVVSDVDTTIWGRVSTLLPYINAFDTDPSSRPYQDIGFDGLKSGDEQLFFYNSFISNIESMYGSESVAYMDAMADPSADDYHYYRSSTFDLNQVSILDRYKRYNGMEGNSPTLEQSPEPYPIAAKIFPDSEDINDNNMLDENEAYFQYRVSLRPADMQLGLNYIEEIKESTVLLANGSTETIKWYRFRVPVNSPERQAFGAISDDYWYKSIRIVFKNFHEPIICRFATFNMILEKVE
jgi:cell surface protein SprA